MKITMTADEIQAALADWVKRKVPALAGDNPTIVLKSVTADPSTATVDFVTVDLESTPPAKVEV